MALTYDKFKGCLFGQAIGDALGLGTEFMTAEEVKEAYPKGLRHYDDIVQDWHRRRWSKGMWSDDTDMMICIAGSVIEDKEVNLRNIAWHFKNWADGGPMGIGQTTHNVLSIGDYAEKPFEVSRLIWKMSHYKAAANGGLMRTSVVGLFHKAVKESAENICKLTHYDPRCVGSCVIVSELINALVYDKTIPDYEEMVDIANEYDDRIASYITLAYREKYVSKLMDDEHIGYTLVTLSVALWAYWHAESFEDGLLKVVNAGGDADTNAAVACAILGAKFGYSSIPREYVDGLYYRKTLQDITDQLAKIFLK